MFALPFFRNQKLHFMPGVLVHTLGDFKTCNRLQGFRRFGCLWSGAALFSLLGKLGFLLVAGTNLAGIPGCDGFCAGFLVYHHQLLFD
ncbi:MAG: hypothetical protein DIKNOCCD_03205 [bacterium]|nr:hypothetical protein [bacterium]